MEKTFLLCVSIIASSSSTNGFIQNTKVNSSILDTTSLWFDNNPPTILNISNNELTYISPNYFTKLPILKLYMNHNPAYEFPRSHAFITSGQLTKYECSGCNITHIDRETFVGLPELTHLDLSMNRIDYIHSDAFEKNSKLYLLTLDHNRLSSVNEIGHLSGLRSLGYLLMNGNAFEFSNKPLIAPSDVLRVFECNHCKVKDACSKVIEPYPNLMKLHLVNNSLTNLNCLKGKNIYWLDVSHNPKLKIARLDSAKIKSFACNFCSFTEVSAELFKNLPVLETISLSNNNIVKIDEKAFATSPKIAKIKLENNAIEQFRLSAINGLGELTTMCISGNPIAPNYANKLFVDYYRARSLSLGCSLQETSFLSRFPEILSEESKSFVRSKSFRSRGRSVSHIEDLSDQNMEFIEVDYFANAPHVKMLNMSHNRPFHFQKDTAFLQHASLEEIDASCCNITTIYRETFSELPNLLRLDLSHNQISTIAENAFKFTKLQELILDFNKIEYLPSRSVDKANNLVKLSMSGNENFNFEEDQIFLYHSNLQKFICEKCGITVIYRDTFSRMTNLRDLVLAGNSIDEIEPDSFEKNVELAYLNLDNNQLETFNVELLTPLEKLKFFCIDDNESMNTTANENNFALKRIYVERDFRSPYCAGNLKIELILPNPVEVVNDETVVVTEVTETSVRPTRGVFENLKQAVEEDDDYDGDDMEANVQENVPTTKQVHMYMPHPEVKISSIGGGDNGANSIKGTFGVFLGVIMVNFFLVVF